MNTKKAIIDIGSNSILLLVAEKTPQGWKTIKDWSKVTALGQGTKQTGLLSEESIRNTLIGLKEAFDIAHQAGAENIVGYATMAARMASNTQDFLIQAEKQETPVSVLSGEDEARLGFLSVAEDPLYSHYDHLSIIDIGAQSTEIVIGSKTNHQWDIKFLYSFPIGGWGVRGEYFPTEQVSSEEIFNASKELDDLIYRTLSPWNSGEIVSLGASGVNLVQIRDNIEYEDFHHQYKVLEYEEISRAVGWLSDMTDEERKAIKGLEPGRERTIHSSALILERFLYALKKEKCFVSNKGWRYGLLNHVPTERVLI